jgi:hypothetical protein
MSEEWVMAYGIPKPRKEDRKRANFDTSDMPYAKSHFDRDGEYRAWIRTHRCLLYWLSPCVGEVEAAHLERGGRGIKGSDYSCVPLCGKKHHKLLDGNSLDFEVEKFLWAKAWEFLAQRYRRSE